MNKQLVITEKPSVAADIARALGGFTKHDDYFESPTMLIAAAAGHLLESRKPTEQWDLDLLPILPTTLELVPKSAQEERLEALVSMLNRSDVAGVINACDAGREGELIFREIMRYAGCKKPIQRAWLQSMTAAAIRRAFETLRSEADVRGLASAADCRTVADWLIGINITRALTGLMSRAGGFFKTPAGRVQTPTLIMITERELEIARFVRQPYWQIAGKFVMGDGSLVDATWVSRRKAGNEAGEDHGRRVGSRERADAIVAKVTGQPAAVSAKQRVDRKQPPQLFKLNDLLIEASNKHHIPAAKTQRIVQTLYSDKKLITYPRTESRYLPSEDYLETVRDRLRQIAAAMPELTAPAQAALDRGVDPANKRVFDSSKVGDHFAIIPEPIGPDQPKLAEDEQKIYDLIVKRFVAAFLPASETDVHVLTFTVAGETFEATTSSLRTPGWQAVDGKRAQPPVTFQADEASQAKALSATVEERLTTPPPRYNDGTLLKAMETAGERVDDEEAHEAMKLCGLGTAATRTDTINKLLAEGYIKRHSGDLHAEPKAMTLMQLIGRLKLEVLSSPVMTGRWEARLAEIEQGIGDPEAFMRDIRQLTAELVAQVKSSPADLVLAELPHISLPGTDAPLVQRLLDYTTADGAVRIPKVLYGRHLAVGELEQLFAAGWIGPLEGFYSPKKKTRYDGCLRWNRDTQRCELFFDKLKDPLAAEHPQIGVCPHCGGAVHERPAGYVCVNAIGEQPMCGFALKRLWCGREITRDKAQQLIAHGRTDMLEGFRGQNGRRFKAAIVVEADGKPVFEFAKPRARRA
jgi:DNA topoisomerase-3